MNYRSIGILLLSCIILNAYADNKKALIFGINGQDGCFLSTFLYNKGYDVYGVIKSEKADTQKLKATLNQNGISSDALHLLIADLTEEDKIKKIISDILPDEIYNLAAQSNIDVSFQEPFLTTKVNILGALTIFEAIKALKDIKKIKVMHASTVEIFGLNQNNCDENTPYSGASPYGETKIFVQKLAHFYRNHHNLFITCAILSNHESPLRPYNFTTKKITQAVAEYSVGKRDYITVGNIDLIRDWGYAGDFVEAMWLTLQGSNPEDYLIATGEPHSVKEFIEMAFQEINVELDWRGTGLNQQGYDKNTGKMVVQTTSNHLRPVDVPARVGNPAKILRELSWKPRMKFKELVQLMVKEDIQQLHS